MTNDVDNVPIIERPPDMVREDAAEVAPRDSEVDFDDETEDEVPPLDVVEAAEVGALLDDPESLDDEEA
ncbi:MAG TPA: hypothetical protein VED84_07615 [Acidimicrobiales bacterium]|nr:hypothetical protein [Acidimicrobiales bacterium]